MHRFLMHDQAGKFVQCITHGRHATNECIKEGQEIVVFFGTAQAGRNNDTCGALWIYDNSHIVTIRTKRAVPPSRTQVLLR